MKRSWTIMLTVGVALAASLLMTACTPASPFRPSGAGGPEIRVIEPAPNSTTLRGSTVVIRASIQDPAGVNSVSLRVNGQAAQTINLSTPPVTELTQELFWTPEMVGTYEIKVDALNRRDEWGHSAPMTVFVVEPFARETVIAVPSATAGAAAGGGGDPTPTHTPTPPVTCIPSRPTVQPWCRDSAAYVSDVTVPDGTVFAPGAAFDKTWRLRNTGTCTWNTRYQLIFVGGSQLSAPGAVNMPHDVTPNSTVDITVRMVAPQANGRYRSDWQMQNPDCCNRFGPIVYAQIQVGADGGGDDRPVITRFEVVPNAISQGQGATLHWEYRNGTSARIYPNDVAVGSTGSLNVTPNATTTYRLVVTNDAGSVERTTTLIVRPAPAPPAPATPANLAITGVHIDGFDFSWVDTSSDEQGFRLYDANTGLSVAVFPANVTSSAIRGLACGTSHRFYLVSFNERGESWPSNTVQDSTSPCGGS